MDLSIATPADPAKTDDVNSGLTGQNQHCQYQRNVPVDQAAHAKRQSAKVNGKAMRRMPAEMRRRQLVQTTLQQVAERGVMGTTVSGIAAAAGVSQATVYQYFPSRKKILEAALDMVLDQLTQTIVSATGSNVIERLQRIDEAHTAALSSRRTSHVRPLFQFYVAPPKSELAGEIRRRALSMVPTFASLIEEGKAQGVIRKDVDPQPTAWKLLAIYWLKDISRLLGVEGFVTSGPSAEMLQSLLAEISEGADIGRDS